MGELLASLFEIFVQFLALLIEGLALLISGSVCIIAYTASPKFRARKRQEWNEFPKRRYVELGISGVCVASLMVLVAWFSFSATSRSTGRRDDDLKVEKHQNGGVHLTLKTESKNGVTNHTMIGIKQGGVSKILHTKSLDELSHAVRENVTFISNQTTAAKPGSQP